MPPMTEPARSRRLGALAHNGAGVVPMLTSLSDLSSVGSRAAVVDIVTRHVVTDTAATRAVSVDAIDATRYAHKIDSTLRGNWASELVARHAATGHPVLVVPAYPALGRTCVGGIVFDDVFRFTRGSRSRRAGTDQDQPPGRPAEGAGALDVVGCRDLTDLVDWLEVPGGIAIADAATTTTCADRQPMGRCRGVLLAGTSGAIGAAGARLFDSEERNNVRPWKDPCSSCAAAPTRGRRAGGSGRGSRVRGCSATGTSAPSTLSTRGIRSCSHRSHWTSRCRPTRQRRRWRRWRGGDHDLGQPSARRDGRDRRRHRRRGPRRGALDVGGSVVDGMPWSLRPGRDRPLIVTRAGGFGGRHALVDLLWGTLRHDDRRRWRSRWATRRASARRSSCARRRGRLLRRLA